MHTYASYNGQIVRSNDIRIAGMSAAALYGKGVFTTVAIYRGEKDRWREHSVRLSRDAGKLDIDVSSLDLVEIGGDIDKLVHENRVDDGKARVTIFDEGSTTIWPAELMNRTSVLITTGDRPPPPEHFRVMVSSYIVNSTSPLAGVKSCNYLEKIFARAEARTRGFDECIQLNEHAEVVSASMANVFWLNGDELFTPSLTTGCNAGTTRSMVIEAMKLKAARLVEVESGIAELRKASEIYLTSSGLGVVQVAEFGSRALESNDPHGLTRFAEHKNTRNRSE